LLLTISRGCCCRNCDGGRGAGTTNAAGGALLLLQLLLLFVDAAVELVGGFGVKKAELGTENGAIFLSNTSINQYRNISCFGRIQ
jgi:hypothetical protein